MLPGSAVGLGKRLFEDGGSRAWLYGAAMHGDTPPDGAGSAIAAFYLNLLGHAVGWPSPRGGAERLTDALVSYLRVLGGEIRTGVRVERVLSAGGRVTGVASADERFPAHDRDRRRDAGRAGADGRPAGLVPGRAEDATSPARRRSRSTGRSTARSRGRTPRSTGAGTVHVAGGEDEFLRSVEQAHDGLADHPFLLLGQQSVADPTRAPEGKHTAWAYTHGPQQGVDWATATPVVAERMEAQVERFAPGFRDRILARHVLGPADLEARNANLVGGDVGGGRYRLRQVVFRPIPKLSPYSTPLKGLFIGSAATFPGGAVHGVPGRRRRARRAALGGGLQSPPRRPRWRPRAARPSGPAGPAAWRQRSSSSSVSSTRTTSAGRSAFSSSPARYARSAAPQLVARPAAGDGPVEPEVLLDLLQGGQLGVVLEAQLAAAAVAARSCPRPRRSCAASGSRGWWLRRAVR